MAALAHLSGAAGFVVIAVLAALARLATYLAFGSPKGLLRQEPSAIAANINAGLGFVYEQYETMYYGLKEPGHIALLAVLTRVLGDRDLPILILQAACGIAVALLTAVFTRRLTDDAVAGFVAGGLVAVNPFLVYYDSLIVHSLSLDMLLFILTTAAAIWAADDPRLTWRRAVAAGLLAGVALWQRSLLLFGGLGVWGVAVAVARRGRPRQVARAGLWAAVALLLVTPWFARNHAVIGRWVFTTDFAHVVWLGNNPLSNGTYSDAAGDRIFYRADPAFRARIEGRPEVEQMEVFMAAVRDFVRDHPGQAAALFLRKLWTFVWFAPNTGAEYKAWQRSVYVVWYLVLLVAGIAGLVRGWKAAGRNIRRKLALVAGMLLGIMTLHAVVAINMKHRVPLEIVLSGLAGWYVASLLARIVRADAVR